jgi:small subunit ribosomal protein S17
MGKKKEYIGTVVNSNMQKTIVVKIVRLAKHPKYGRIIKITNKFKVHDEKNTAKPGDSVGIREVRPLSKEKRFALVRIVKKAEIVHAQIKEVLPEIIKEKKKNPVKIKEEAPAVAGEAQETKAKVKEAEEK